MVSARLTFPSSWTATVRCRRILFLALAAPGFACVFATPLHQNLLVLTLGAAGFLGAVAFRTRTEPKFVKASPALQPHLPSPHDLERAHAD